MNGHDLYWWVYVWANVHWFPLSIAAMVLIGSIMTALDVRDRRRRHRRMGL